MPEVMSLHEKLIGLATIAAKDPDPRNIRWRLLVLLDQIDAATPNPAFIDECLAPSRDRPVNLRDAA